MEMGKAEIAEPKHISSCRSDTGFTEHIRIIVRNANTMREMKLLEKGMRV